MLLRYQATLHSYGAISTTFRKKAGWIEKPPVDKPPRETLPAAGLALEGPDPKPSGSSGFPALTPESQGEEDSPFVKGRKRNWARLIKKL